MTLKQFFEVAGGIVIGLIIYSTPIIGIVKWPFIFISVLLGVGLAFLPLEERPLEQWIFAFFRAVYSPTLYYWKKNPQINKFFQDETAVQEAKITPQEEEELKKYAATPKSALWEKLERAEEGVLARLSGLFSVSMPMGQGKIVTQSVESQPQPQATPQQQGVKIPQPQPVKVGVNVKPGLVVEEQKTQSPQMQFSKVTPTIAGSELVSTRAAQFSPEAAPPNPPTSPNVIVGQVIDNQKRIVEGAIMEISDSAGRPVRALKSNRLGHFIIVTPLENGKYEISTEKEGHEFGSVSFEANGSIIPPILIQGKKLSN
ncbi:carboxypeptidase-like regulatory domain-containing protein [Patescibacteria group bacterium]